MFVDGMELWYVTLFQRDVEVDVKLYDRWDAEMVDLGNAFHSRDEAEAKAEQVRELLKQPVKVVREQQ